MQTPNLALPCIMPSQAQKHVTHNEALRMLDALVQLCVLDRDRTGPPSEPAEGDRHIVATDAEGLWDGHDGQIASWQDGSWNYFQPAEGWHAWVAAEGSLLVFHGGLWRSFPGELHNLERVGINTTADAVNRLAVASETVLLNHNGAGHRAKINKAGEHDTASLLFQTGFSGRAEMGTVGNDDFLFKVSGDGVNWHNAVVIARGTGAVTLPNTPVQNVRQRLAANRTYYVRTDGNDANNGLSNSAGGAFLTIQKAIDAIADLDIAGFNVVVQLGDGTYTGQVNLRNVTGFAAAGNLIIRGNTGDDDAVFIDNSATNFDGFRATNVAVIWRIEYLKIKVGNTNAACIRSSGTGTTVIFNNIVFGGGGDADLFAEDGGAIRSTTGNSHYAIDGGGDRHFQARYGGSISTSGCTVTFRANCAYGASGTDGFAMASTLGILRIFSMTFNLSGFTVTGKRYYAHLNGVIYAASGENYLPGNTAGATATGGLYG